MLHRLYDTHSVSLVYAIWRTLGVYDVHNRMRLLYIAITTIAVIPSQIQVSVIWVLTIFARKYTLRATYL